MPLHLNLVKRLREGAPRRIARGRKHLWQRLHLDRRASKTPVFVVGCHRSGTSMMVRAITKSPMTRVYDENQYPACSNYRLRSGEVIEALIRKSHAPVVVFKPICDAHLTDRLLQRHENSVALWLFRRYQDVVNSAVRKWQGHQKDILRWIRDGEWSQLGWRGERLSPQLIELVSSLYRDDMTNEEAASIQWYLRNTFLFDLGLAIDHRVMLVKYEDLVGNPQENFKRAFDFIGCPFNPQYVDDVFASSIQKRPSPVIDPRIQDLCEEMIKRLEETYNVRNTSS